MSTQYEKFIAKQELKRRKILTADSEIQRIKSLPTQELQRIINEPTEQEKS